MTRSLPPSSVTPAKAGVQLTLARRVASWTPAFAGVTDFGFNLGASKEGIAMTEAMAQLVLGQLREICASMEHMEFDISDIKVRLTATVVTMGHMAKLLTSQCDRLDRIDDRLGRVERRFELVNA